jgi:hypothetical protein
MTPPSALALLLAPLLAPLASAACVSLKGSSACPAFAAASVSTDDSTVVGY